MYYLPTSCLIYLFIFSLFRPLLSTSSRCETLFQCGNITADFPFWGGDRHKDCGHPSLELHCDKTNNTSLFISKEEYYVFHLNQKLNTLKIARAELLSSFCSSFNLEASLPPETFELSPAYKNLIVFYLCFSPTDKLSSYTCPEIGPILLSSENPKHHLTCLSSCAVNVPRSFDTKDKELNMTNLERVLKQGYEVKVKINEKACQKCSSSHGICSFNKKNPYEFKCIPLHQPTGIFSKAKTDAGISSKAKIGSGVGVTLLLFLFLTTLFLQILRKRKRKTSQALGQQNVKALITLKQYSYTQVKRITNSFAEEVGRGGFGTVYRGTLSDGCMVAVKVLKDSKGNNGEDFINEVASMSQTSHVNIVTLLGFCSESSKRAIIYEFLENGSLDNFISSKKSSNMDWKELYMIALGIARGLEYLHHGCRTRIVHFDIKPQNVLLDENLSPKVSDFGLAKLCERTESILSLLEARGTIGYVAPEVFSSVYGRVSHKSDVYSYGMLVLEIIGARNRAPNEEPSSSTSSTYFPEWIYKDLEKGYNGGHIENGISSEEDNEIAKKMTLVGLWCIQPWPSDRPAMNRVVEMMEGNLDALEVPPRPVLQCSVVPHFESSWISEENSISSY
ncbi:PREDICTED: LEAF RUST 10 DISEASE-RESISTANCE LOCUS RECEPTOR-LIKE PROTEIN KINASE-like 2.4 [Camelina sativa]|uniref:non-specific serine/threonine protein kinase n=1 Tax=Camelina sativa TaxID=90675 RepID=A0ABM0SRV2_CAMSA|nr:PREDICTED: LEAF RUST 10 DISEASE-RESISTANCE LOCUS RECEPTOR-LIKE PROTEIN KINASE-like 2.4 [Camelina sativa]